MSYNHGVRIKENPTSVAAPVTGTSGLQVIFGTAPINLAEDPEHATNKLFLCKTYDEAVAAVGYSDDFENYTLCQSINACFKVFNVAPIVLCNVLDLKKHKADYSEELTFINGQARSGEKGIIKSLFTLQTADGTEKIPDVDYIAEFDDEGYLVITLLTDITTTSLNASGSKLDPSKVTASEVIGGINIQTGEETGIELVRQVYPKFNLVPGLLLAPGWSHKPEVALALAAKCVDINGLFTCECIIDLDTKKSTKYSDCPAAKETAALTNKHMIVLWPMVTIADKKYYYSAVYGAMTAYLDAGNDDVPNLSPSNKLLNVSGAVLADGKEVNLDIVQANILNSAGIVTVINSNGYKAWGNNTAAYPVITDPKDRWICCRRFFSWWGNSFIVTYMSNVDDLADYRLIESIVDAENIKGNSLASQGKCAGAKIEYREDDNNVEEVIDGHIVFRQYLAPYTPAEDILNILEFDPSMIESALGGE